MEILFYIWLFISTAAAALTFIFDDDVTLPMAIRFFFVWPAMLAVVPYMITREWWRMRSVDKSN